MPERHYHHHHHHYDRGRKGYAYQAGEPGPGPNFHRLRRDMVRGKIAGVCAGFSRYFGWNVKWVRIGLILATIIFFPMPAVAYAVLAVVLKRSDERAAPDHSAEEQRFWRDFSVRPKFTIGELRHRYRALDARIAEMEHAVTSAEYGLRRQFRDLERGL